MRNVVIICYHMLPFTKSFGSCQRMFFLAKQLSENNFYVTVISKHEGYKYGNYGQEFHCESLYLTINGKVLDSKQILIEPSISYIKLTLKKIIYKLLAKTSLLFNKAFKETNINHSIEPLIWLMRNKNNINKIIALKNAEIVIISAPPFHLHKLIRSIKNKNEKIKVILDYRDPWNYNTSTISSKIESKNIFCADLITVFSEKYKYHLLKLYSYPKSKVISVYNGFSCNEWSKVIIKQKRIVEKVIFTYAGSYSFSDNNFADISIILNAIDRIPDKSNFIFRFIGNTNEDKEKFWSNKLGECVEFVGIINHRQVLEYLIRSDVQIILFKNNDMRSKFMITTKFFDYLKSGKIIWGIGNSKSNFCQWINEYNLGVTNEPKVEKILETFNEIINNFTNNSRCYSNYKLDVDLYSRERQFEKLIIHL